MKSWFLANGLVAVALLATSAGSASAQDNPAGGTPPAAATPSPAATASPAVTTPPSAAATTVPDTGATTVPAPATGPARTAPAAGGGAAAARAAAAPALAGTWTGEVKETGHAGSYPVKIIITALAAATDYPDQNCSGKLTRVGVNGRYTFYSEKIAVGAYDEAKGTGCIDGTLTLVRSGTNLLMAWVGEMKGEMIVATGTLTQATPGSQKPPVAAKQAPTVAVPPPVAQAAPTGQRPPTVAKPANGKP